MKAYLTRKHIIVELISYIIMAIAVIITTFYVVRHGNDMVPTHYNAMGQVDGWGAAAAALFLPGTLVFVNVVLSLIGHLCPPSHFNLPVKLNPVNAAAVYGDSLMLLFLMELEFSIFCLCSAFSYLYGFAERFGWFVYVLLAAIMITIIAELVLTVKHNRA